jgi:tetratricopeptide (TPR) repeat protein
VSAPIPPASQHNPELPRQVDDALARGLAKDPAHRYDSASELVYALREALDESAGETRIVTAQPTPPGRPRRRLPVVLLVLALPLLAAGILAAALLAGGEDETAGTTPQTVKETVTLPGTTVVQTVTTASPETTAPTTTTAATTTAATTEPEPPEDAVALNDQGFALMQAGDYESALAPLEQAVELSSGSGELVEAYAAYNLAFVRLALGDCTGVAELLDRSEQVQGKRKEISQLRRDARRACGKGNEDGDEG